VFLRVLPAGVNVDLCFVLDVLFISNGVLVFL
jgi:hypothetical protein